MAEPLTFEEWERSSPQNLRDAMAARALLQEWGNPVNALIRLGFAHERDREKREALRAAVFDTPGCRTVLADRLKDAEAARGEMLQRQVQIALHGSDDASVRSFSQLAKIMGWQPAENTGIDNRKFIQQNIYQMVGTAGPSRAAQPQAAAIGFLDHEPGDPQRIDSGEDVIDVQVQETTE